MRLPGLSFASAMSMWLLPVVVAVALLLEVAVRFTLGAPRAEQLPLLRVRPDPELGYRPVPHDEHYAYDRLTRLNSLGLRGPEIPPKAPNQLRIAVLGETQLYGLGLADNELLTHVLERELNELDPRNDYRVSNLGVRAFGLTQQLRLLETLGKTLRPDHVIVFFYAYGFRRVDIASYYTRVRGRDWYMLDLGGKPAGLVLWRWRLVQFARKSALMAFLHYLYKNWNERNRVANKLLRGERDPQVETALAHVKEHISRFRSLVMQYNSGLTLIVIPLPRQLAREYHKNQYQSALRKIATEHQIGFFDLLPSLRELYERTKRLPVAPFDDHYDAAAHSTMAKALAKHLRH